MKIRNHGARVPREELEKVFDPYSMTRTYGAGLSLTPAKKIVEEHHGSVSVASDDEGTVFIAMIPAVSETEPRQAVAQG